jgi:Sigma-70, region 4
MSKAQQASAARHVELLFNAGTTTGLSDMQLLERFLDRGGESRDLAFATLIERHGPMVRRFWEIARLPERFRAPIVLCCLEGLTQQQAAGQTGWALGTLQSRLARGRERLRGRLIRRGIAPSIGLSAAVFPATGARGAVSSALLASTIDAAMEFSAIKGGCAAPATSSLSSLTNEVVRTMYLHNLKRISAALLTIVATAAGVGVWARQESTVAPNGAPEPATRIKEPIPVKETAQPAAEDRPDALAVAELADYLKYGDGQADGKKSIGGSGELIEFSGTAGPVKVAGVRIHGSRYGQAQPPQESFLIYFLNNDLTRILHTEMAPYSLLERGPEELVEVSFERPVELPKTFWVALDFRATQSKGVYVSYDTSTGGKHSRVGLPGARTSNVTFGGDWMVEATLAK